MNVDISKSASSSKTEVTSKYFGQENILDDSLSEFQEKKKNITGPKKVQPKKHRKKPIKQIKGQKDIKSLFKRKNNELVKYSSEFDQVCKRLGVDVDSEQLQLAISLSKSLQDTKNSPAETPDEEKSLSSQARVLKIRKTLQEYGFKVPDTKVLEANRRIRKRKNYKLIELSDLEKQQITSDRYAQVLLNNLYITNNTVPIGDSSDTLYHRSTNVLYENIKDNSVFVVSNLFEKPVNKIDRLRNWSEIPGRPVSPVFEGPFISFNDIECTQDELDSILSSSLKKTQEILRRKLEINSESLNMQFGLNINTKMPEIDCDHIERQNSCISPKEWKELQTTTNAFLSVLQQSRCVSPDLFDEDVSVIEEVSHSLQKDGAKNKTNCSNHEIMDLTECVNIDNEFINIDTNSTIRKSNNFMEVPSFVKSVSSEAYEEIDLTQNYEEGNDNTVVYCVGDQSMCEKSPNIDEVYTIMDDDCNSGFNNKSNVKDSTESLDLTQGSNSSEELPGVIISGKSKDVLMDETIIINEYCYEIIENNKSDGNDNQKDLDSTKDNGFQISGSKTINENEALNNINIEEVQVVTDVPDNIDLTQSSDSSLAESFEYSINNNFAHPLEELGKINEISVDYDKMFDNVMESYSHTTGSSHKSDEFNQSENLTNNDIVNTTNKHAETVEISDKLPNSNYIEFGGISVLEEFSNDSKTHNICVQKEDSFLPTVEIENTDSLNCNYDLEIDNYDTRESSPLKDQNNKNYDILKTPSNKDYIIKTDEVTPMPNYETMSSPEMNRELDKYGIKPFKRKRAIKLLTYIYNQTHPIVDSCVEDEASPSKKLKTLSQNSDSIKSISPKIPRTESSQKSPANTANKENTIYEVTDENPVIKHIECNPEDWMFQTREKAKVSSCRVPLHIAFHNYVHSRRFLREAILCYEPINIDIVHKDLVASGYRYNPKDLLKFMDKKCITVKTTDNDKRNKR